MHGDARAGGTKRRSGSPMIFLNRNVEFRGVLHILSVAPGTSLQVNFMKSTFQTTGSSRHVRQTIAFATTKPRFGGTRWWFVCPSTGKRVGRLHLPPGATEFLSRRAHGLTYACQTEDFDARAVRRSRKLMARLGADAGPSWPPPLKPKRMRWATYLRYAGQIEACERVADRRWVKVAGRWMARGLHDRFGSAVRERQMDSKFVSNIREDSA
jgi:hypothetical protein